MVDDKTSHLDLPLPHPTNELADDVIRLRAALNGIDAQFQALDALLQSDDVTLDQVQELVTAIKDNRSTIDGLLTGKADSSRVTALEAVAQVEETHVLADGQTVVDLTVLTGTAGASVFVEGVRLKASAWTPDGTIATRLTLNSTYPAGHEVTVVRQQGGV